MVGKPIPPRLEQGQEDFQEKVAQSWASKGCQIRKRKVLLLRNLLDCGGIQRKRNL